MRQVTELSTTGDVTIDVILEDTVLDFIDDVTESNNSYQLLQNSITEDTMATVFPSSASSDHLIISRNKASSGMKTQTKSHVDAEKSGSVSKISRNVLSLKDSLPSVDCPDKQSSVLNKNNNSIHQPDIGHECERSERHHCLGHEEISERVNGKSVSGFQNTVIEALIEQPQSVVVNQANEIPPTRKQNETQKVQASLPVVKFTKCDDVITTEITSHVQESDTMTDSAITAQDGGGAGKKRWSTRISNGLVNLFQKRSASSPSLPGSTDTDGLGRHDRISDKKASARDTCRQTSFAGKLISVIDWRRKPPNRSKSVSRHRIKEDSGSEEKKEVDSDNKVRVPIFVLPQNQVEIVEDAPQGIAQEHKQLLRESWCMIKADVAEVGVETFMGLFHTHPDSIDSFLAFKDKSVEDLEKSAVLKAHSLRVMQTVDKCITRLDDVDKMAAVLCALGKRHIGYQANASLVPMIGKQFISAIKPKMGDRWSDEVHDAWSGLFRTINYNLRQGMMQEKHRLAYEAASGKK